MRDLSENTVADLMNGLVKAIDNVLEDHPSYKMLGRSFVCPDSVSDKSEAFVLKLRVPYIV